MRKKTIDAALRSTWNAVSKMYNREASKFDSTMATGFALLNIEAEGTPSSSLGPKLGMESTSLSRLLKSMEKKKLIIRKMAGVYLFSSLHLVKRKGTIHDQWY